MDDEHNKIVKLKNDLVHQVSNAVSITNKLLCRNLQSLKILHLDDHSLFAGGIGNCIRASFPNVEIKHIQNGTVALAYILDSLLKDDDIDLIITDMSHPGLSGLEFAQTFREKENGPKRIPILFITMHGRTAWFRPQVEKIPFCAYLSKEDGCERIIAMIYKLVYNHEQ